MESEIAGATTVFVPMADADLPADGEQCMKWHATTTDNNGNASSRTVESTARRVLPVNTPVTAMTILTASKIRSGRSEAANRRRQYVNVVA